MFSGGKMRGSLLIFITTVGLQIMYLSSCDGKTHNKHHQHEDKEPEPQSDVDGGCYSKSVPQEEQIIPAICNVSNALETSPSPFNITTNSSKEKISVCIISNGGNGTEERIYTVTVKEIVDGKEVNPTKGKWKHFGSELCCFSNDKEAQKKHEFEQSIVQVSSDLKFCGKWHAQREIGTKQYKFIAVSCDSEKRCWKQEVVAVNS